MWEQSAIIAVGDEVLTGEVVNTNGSWLARELLVVGSRPMQQITVGDDVDAISGAISTALAQTDLVVLVGGLGPTPDDMTRQGAARALDREIAFDAEVAEQIRRRHRRGPGHEASIAQQSQILQGAEVLPNPVGTAPGQLIRIAERAVALLPGPPAECRGVAATLLTRVREATGRRVARMTWRCYDLTESEMAHHLGDLLRGLHPRAGLYTRPGAIELRLEAEATQDTMPPIIARAAAEARSRLPVPLYDETLPSQPTALIQALAASGQTIALAESMTGGRLAMELITVPGASKVVMEGNVVYTDSAKVRIGCSPQLLAKFGAVSPETAEALAKAVRERTGADWGIAVTGFAGPDGGNEKDPVGTYYCAVAWANGVDVRRRRSRSGREVVQQAACETARFMLALNLVGGRFQSG